MKLPAQQALVPSKAINASDFFDSIGQEQTWPGHRCRRTDATCGFTLCNTST